MHRNPGAGRCPGSFEPAAAPISDRDRKVKCLQCGKRCGVNPRAYTLRPHRPPHLTPAQLEALRILATGPAETSAHQLASRRVVGGTVGRSLVRAGFAVDDRSRPGTLSWLLRITPDGQRQIELDDERRRQ
jgi:hypothetical protein